LIIRANANVAIAPTVAEHSPLSGFSPTNGAQATVSLSDGSRELWEPDGTIWALRRTLASPSAGGSTVKFISRLTSTRNQPPTAGEFPAPVLDAQSHIVLADGTSEFWSHDGTTWNLDRTVEPSSDTRTFTRMAHGLAIGDRIYFNKLGQPQQGNAATGEAIPRLLVTEILV